MTHDSNLLIAIAMWTSMMVAMMLPGVAPAVKLHSAMYRDTGSRTITPTWLFLGGYAITWLGYSTIGASLQVLLQKSGALDLDSRLASTAAAAVLVSAGLFQFTRVKDFCLTKCRNPLSFFLNNWKDGPASSLGLGLRHGLFCVGCCWALMALGFAVGLMNVLWMGAITVVITAEKLLPRGRLIGRAAGVGLVVWGLVQY